MRVGSLCSGYGGLELAIEQAFPEANVEIAWHSEIDLEACLTLERHRPGVKNYGDIRNTTSATQVDCLAMGVPCETVSNAGLRMGDFDPRWLWPYAHETLKALRPKMLVFENVRGLISFQGGRLWTGPNGILSDMRKAGYAVSWLTIGACTVGAPHHRHRVFAVGEYVGANAPVAERVETNECDATMELLATPLARDSAMRNEGDASYWLRRGRPMSTAPLGAQLRLLPTPTARDGMGGPGHSTSGGLNPRTAVAYFGPYVRAVERWERISRTEAPAPTVLGPRGGIRLSASLPEWMMGLPRGYLTDTPDVDARSAIRLAGKGVCPAQGAKALQILW